MLIDDIITFLHDNLDPQRTEHSLKTASMASTLAKIHGEDERKAYMAGLLHDIAKGLSGEAIAKTAEDYRVSADEYEQNNKELLHGRLGAAMANKLFGITDEDVLNAIRWHTTGRAGMSRLEKIVYIADLTEPSRKFDDLDDIRELAKKDVDLAMRLALQKVMEFVKRKGFALHPNSIKAYNDLFKEEEK